MLASSFRSISSTFDHLIPAFKELGNQFANECNDMLLALLKDIDEIEVDEVSHSEM